VPGPLRTFTRLPSATGIDRVAIVVAVVSIVGETGVEGNGVAIGADRVAVGLGIKAVGVGWVTVGEAAIGNVAAEDDTRSGSACVSRQGLHPIAIVRKRTMPTKAIKLLILIGIVLILTVNNVFDVISLSLRSSLFVTIIPPLRPVRIGHKTDSDSNKKTVLKTVFAMSGD
jgi:hypothetical protein